MKSFLTGIALALLAGPVLACTVSKAQYDALREGMTQSQVESVLGCPGIEMSSSNIAGIRTAMYMWEGRGMMGANMNVMIQDGRMVMKAQFGLN